MAEKSEAREFFVDSNFQKMARRPGGVPREKAIERAQAKIEEMKPAFSEWLDEELQKLEAAIRQLEGNPGDTAHLDGTDRCSRQLGDVGATMGYELLTFIANNLCGILNAIKAGADYDKEMIDCHVSALHLSRQEPYRSMRPEQVPELTRGLRRTAELAGTVVERATK
jgi:chemotaxis protein histidine kinase CheA